jgi:2-dehydropantoate 2-reductase
MEIAIVGTGGVGGYYGGLLARQGHAVTFIARGEHLNAIREKGLQVESVHGDFRIEPAKATDNPAEIGPVELVLFCTKTYANEGAARQVEPIVGPETTVMSLQNGVEAAEQIGRILGSEHLIGGTTWISSSVAAPGVIKQVSQFRRIVLGELNGQITARVQAIFSAFQETGITIELSEDILKILWTKFVFISAISSMGSLTRLPIGEYRDIRESRSMMIGLMREIEALAHAQNIDLDQDVVEQSLDFIDNAAAHIRASMQLDVAAGRRSEIESMVGVIGRKGRELGISTLTADLIYAALLPIDLKARGDR